MKHGISLEAFLWDRESCIEIIDDLISKEYMNERESIYHVYTHMVKLLSSDDTATQIYNEINED